MNPVWCTALESCIVSGSGSLELICFISLCLCFLSWYMIELVIKLLRANSRSFNSKWRSDFVDQKTEAVVVCSQCLPQTYLWGRISRSGLRARPIQQLSLPSQAASFLSEVSVKALDRSGTGLHRLSWGWHCFSVTTKPWGPLSVMSLVFRCGSKYAIAVSPDSSVLVCSNALLNSGIHWKGASCLLVVQSSAQNPPWSLR